FVAEYSAHGDRSTGRLTCAELCRERARRCGVVGHVQNPLDARRRARTYDLETAPQRDCLQTAFDRRSWDAQAPSQRLERCKHCRCVVELDLTVQCRRRQIALLAGAPAPGPARTAAYPVEVAAKLLQVRSNRLRGLVNRCRHVASSEDRGPARAKDARLLAADRLAVAAQPVAVIEVDRGDQRDV